MGYKQPDTKQLDECTENVEKVLYYIFLIVAMVFITALSVLFTLLLNGLYLARYILVKHIIGSRVHVARFSTRKLGVLYHEW